VAFIATFEGLTVAEALDFVKRSRSMAEPNFSFMEQLKKMERQGFFRRLKAQQIGS